jgi:hypothetical protein
MEAVQWGLPRGYLGNIITLIHAKVKLSRRWMTLGKTNSTSELLLFFFFPFIFLVCVCVDYELGEPLSALF